MQVPAPNSDVVCDVVPACNAMPHAVTTVLHGPLPSAILPPSTLPLGGKTAPTCSSGMRTVFDHRAATGAGGWSDGFHSMLHPPTASQVVVCRLAADAVPRMQQEVCCRCRVPAVLPPCQSHAGMSWSTSIIIVTCRSQALHVASLFACGKTWPDRSCR
jgi:hypothetical protein